MPFQPYLFFGGNCREAFTRYHEIFGGDLQIMTAGDAPQDEGDGSMEMDPDLVIHAAVMVGDELLMGSDDMAPDGFGPVQGMMVSYSCPEVDRAREVFTKLAEGGTVTQEPIETFFSPIFAMCTDRFGTPWMVTADQPEGASG